MSTVKKARALETLIEILERSISDTAKIERNKKILDEDGILREIDIYIEETLNKRTYITAIECKNYASPISLEKIDAFYGKCLRIPSINKKIYVTTNEYQKGAIDKAKKLGIELCQIKDITDVSIVQQFGVKGVVSMRKKLKIIDIGFTCLSVFDKPIKLTDKHTLLHDGEVLTQESIERIVTEERSIWKFLETKDGLIFNHKKIVYPIYKVEGVYVNINNQKIYPIEKLRLKAEIGFIYSENTISSIKTYQSNIEGSIADFSQLEFSDGEIVHKVEIIKTDKEHIIFTKNEDESDYLKLSTFEKISTNLQFEKKKTNTLKNVQIKALKYKMSDECLDGVQKQTVNNNTKSNPSQLKRKTKSEILFGVDEHNKEVFFMIPLRDRKLLAGHFPDPINLYINNAIDFYNISKTYKESMTNAVDEKSQSILFQDGDYYKYLQYKASSIFMLRSAIELFINSTINDNFIFEKEYTKEDIINTYTVNDKINNILPITTSFKINSNKKIINSIVELCELSDELQNLKTSNTINHPYLEVFAKMINLNLEELIEQTKSFMKKVNGYTFHEI